MKISELAKRLEENKEKIEKRQLEIESGLSERERNRYCRNGGTHGGWTVPGNAAWTKAIKMAGLKTDSYWSGSNPTPSTQCPVAYAEFLTEITRSKEA